MKKLFFTILFTFHLFSLANAEVIKQLEVVGNKRISSETIKIYGGIELNKNYTESDLNKILNNLYSTDFFEDVNVELTNGKLKVILKEYPVINNLVIIGEASKKYKEAIQKSISSKAKGSYIRKNITKDVEAIKRLYSSVGYNLVKVDTKFKKLDDENIDIIFEIDRGELTRITKISFTGDKKIKEKRLRDIIASEEYKFYKFISRNTRFSDNLNELDLRLLKNYYKSLGYYDVKVTSSSAEIKETGNVELNFSIDAGDRYVINKILTNVDPVFDKNIFFSLNNEYQKHIGTFYSPFKVQKLLENIDDLIDKNNMQFVEHNVEELKVDGSITIKFNIYEGERVLVERINVLGNNITNENVIRGELYLDEGDPFTNLNLDKSIAKLKSRNIFSSVTSKISEGSEKNLKIIDINVEEKPTGEISAGAGIGTSGGSVAFNVTENNWLGEGKKVGFQIELTDESLRGRLDYTDPNYDFLGNSINYNLYSNNNDKPNQGYENTLIGFGLGTTFEQYKDLFANLGFNASYDDLSTDETASATLKKQSGTFSDLSGFYGFKYDKRNRSFMPTSGSVTSFSQELPIVSDKGAIVNLFSSSLYKTINEDIIGATKFYLKAVNGISNDDVRLSKRTNLSTNRLRGFQKGKVGPVDGSDHIGGNYAMALNFEANLPNFLPENSKTDIGLFLDFGNVWGVDYDSTIDESNKLRSSTGLAASWLSPLGPMTFVFSTNLSKASTDETESFNFNLGTTF